MEFISKVKSLSVWIFLIPFIALNSCLFIVIYFNEILPVGVGIGKTFPYLDGGTSISRTARYFPLYLIFKPMMFLTSYLLVKYWIYNKNLIYFFDPDNKKIKYFTIFGILSAICLTLHSIFLGIKFDYDAYKLFRRIILLSFIIFELVAQAYLVYCIYKIKDSIIKYINLIYLKLKIFLVSILFITAVVSAPIVSLPGNKFLKHALEWDYFLGVILFYLLTYFLWKKTNS
tara:strand:- start:650 stop:1339 length:690 start_codon:yes stop_codon:yes gene_type:complete